MHPRIDLGLVLCAFDRHDPVLVPDRSVGGRHVLYRRCLRCSRTLRPKRGARIERAHRSTAYQEPLP